MSDITKDQVVEWLSGQSVIEVAELVKELEEKWGVSAAAPAAVAVAAPAAGGDAAGESAEEKSEFNVKLKEFPADKKISMIKAVKNLLQIGLADAKGKVESAPVVLGENVAKEEAEKMKKELEEAGGVVILE